MRSVILAESQIVDMILDRLVENLTIELSENVPVGDKARINAVKKGLLIENKVQNVIQIGIQGGDREQPDMQDGIVSMDTLPNIGINYVPREIGGGQTWARRGVIKLECFFPEKRYDEIDSFKVAYVALGRTIRAINSTPVSDLIDSFGERAWTIHAYSNTYNQSGGPPSSYIFRGKINWVCYTEMP